MEHLLQPANSYEGVKFRGGEIWTKKILVFVGIIFHYETAYIFALKIRSTGRVTEGHARK